MFDCINWPHLQTPNHGKLHSAMLIIVWIIKIHDVQDPTNWIIPVAPFTNMDPSMDK